MGHARALLALPAAQQAAPPRAWSTRHCRCAKPSGLSHAAESGASARARARTQVATPIPRGSKRNWPSARREREDRARPQGRPGRLVIRYSSLEQLDGILAQHRSEMRRPKPRREVSAQLRPQASLRLLQPSCFSIVSRVGHLELARRFDVQRLHDAVVDQHREALAAHAHAARGEVELEAERLRVRRRCRRPSSGPCRRFSGRAPRRPSRTRR